MKISGPPRRLAILGLGRRGHVVVGDHCADAHVFAGGHLHGQLAVHIVAGIVAVQAGYAGALVGGPNGRRRSFGGGRGENLAHRHRVDQARADIAEKRRLMARTAAGDDAHAALARWPGLDDDARVGLVLAQFDARLRMPRSMSSTTWSGSLMTRFITRAPVFYWFSTIQGERLPIAVCQSAYLSLLNRIGASPSDLWIGGGLKAAVQP